MDTTFDKVTLKNLIEASPLSYKENEGSFIFDCPRCGRADKLWMRKRDGQFICWYCAEIDRFKGRPEYALKELLGMPLDEIRNRLYGESWHTDEGYLNLELRDPNGDEEYINEPSVNQVPFPSESCEIDHPHARRGADYLAGRGIPVDVAASYGIRYWPLERRVIFPAFIHDILVGYQSRAVFPTEWTDRVTGEKKSCAKILTSIGLERDKTVMFYNRLKGSRHAVLCEGPVDALKAHLCGGNVATMGKIVTKGQLNLLRCQGIEKVYLALDPDAALEATRIARELGDLELYVLEPPPGYKDLGDMSMEAVRELFDTAPKVLSNHLFVYLRRP